jgi:hypothetical protein
MEGGERTRLCGKFVEHSLRTSNVGSAETLGEPPRNAREKIAAALQVADRKGNAGSLRN